MRPPCETIVTKYLPNIRSIIVKELVNNYGMKQIDVSKILEITQASVSQYMSSSRGEDNELLKNFPELKLYASECAYKIAKGEIKCFVETLCEICSKIRENPKFFEQINNKTD